MFTRNNKHSVCIVIIMLSSYILIDTIIHLVLNGGSLFASVRRRLAKRVVKSRWRSFTLRGRCWPRLGACGRPGGLVHRGSGWRYLPTATHTRAGASLVTHDVPNPPDLYLFIYSLYRYRCIDIYNYIKIYRYIDIYIYRNLKKNTNCVPGDLTTSNDCFMIQTP